MTERPQKTILCIDDEKMILSALERILHPFPYRVLTSDKSSSAMDLILSEHPDLIFLDIHMPSPDGYDLLKEIREQGISAPVVFLTGSASDEETIKGYGLGCSYYIAKPFKPEYVKNIVKFFLAELTQEEREALELKL